MRRGHCHLALTVPSLQDTGSRWYSGSDWCTGSDMTLFHSCTMRECVMGFLSWVSVQGSGEATKVGLRGREGGRVGVEHPATESLEPWMNVTYWKPSCMAKPLVWNVCLPCRRTPCSKVLSPSRLVWQVSLLSNT